MRVRELQPERGPLTPAHLPQALGLVGRGAGRVVAVGATLVFLGEAARARGVIAVDLTGCGRAAADLSAP